MFQLILSMYWFASDVLQVLKRNLKRYLRLPQLIVFATIQPVMFVLLFVYVFGGAIKIPGVDYVNYLLPGILAQVVMFGAIQTGVGLADDFSGGMIDRFRSLPMARSAVLAGRTLADMVRNVFVITLILSVGWLVGFRPDPNILHLGFAFILALLFGFAFSWISAFVGILVKNVEAVQVAAFVWTFPLVFASSVFVPVQSMPDWLQSFAKVSPITVTVNAIRGLALGSEYVTPFLQSLSWIAGILIVFAPLCVWIYRRQSS